MEVENKLNTRMYLPSSLSWYLEMKPDKCVPVAVKVLLKVFCVLDRYFCYTGVMNVNQVYSFWRRVVSVLLHVVTVDCTYTSISYKYIRKQNIELVGNNSLLMLQEIYCTEQKYLSEFSYSKHNYKYDGKNISEFKVKEKKMKLTVSCLFF